ncbi:unnamed protein product [Linum trigynum]|uniref:B-like cyclin n=1 Tax=Linum trigynum TaxID=586398 RepID=A0AAV2D7F4_9ROSI
MRGGLIGDLLRRVAGGLLVEHRVVILLGGIHRMFHRERGPVCARIRYLARFRSQSLDAFAREEAVAWILKVRAYYNFAPLTTYLAVNYLDRFLYSRCLPSHDEFRRGLGLHQRMEEKSVGGYLG